MRRNTAHSKGQPLAYWPRFSTGIAAAVYAACTLALAWPALAGKFLVSSHSDQYIAGFPFRDFAAQSLRSGNGFPQWNPYLFGGMPYIGAMHGDIFYPTFLLRMLMPTDAAMTWGFAIHLFLAGLFAFLFFRAALDEQSEGRNISFGFFACLIGGLAYMYGGQIASLVSPGHDGKLFVSALFPLGLWTLVRGIRDGKGWSWGIFALTIGLAVLSPHPQLLQYMLLASGAYAIFLAVRSTRAGTITSRIALTRLGLALFAVIVGAAIGAVQYLPVREYVAWSPRAGGLSDYAIATSYAWNPEEIFNVYLPQFSGMLEAYWGRNGIHLHSEYMGVAVLILMGGAWLGMRENPRRSQIVFWSVTLLIALLWAMGSSTPFYRIPYALVPGTKFFRAPQTVFFVGSLAIAFLAAAGTERLVSGAIARRYLAGWVIFGFSVALLATAGGLTSIAQAIAPDAAFDRVAANSGALVSGAWRSALFVVITVAVLFAHSRERLTSRTVGIALTALVALDLWTVMRNYWIFSQPASELYAADATIEYLKREKEPARVLAVALDETGHRDPNLMGDGLMAHKIRTVLGYHGNQLGRYNELSGKDQDYRAIFSPLFWRVNNTRFVLTNTADIPQLQKILGPVRDASGTPVYLYRTPGDNPYAWVAPAKVKAADLQGLRTLLDPRFDPRTVAIFDSAAAITATEQIGTIPNPLPIKVAVTSYEPGKVSLTLDSPAPAGSALVVSENFYPGWRAHSGGKELNLARADFTLIGVELPAGTSALELSFESEAYGKGKLVTLLALLASVLMIAAGLLLPRRSSVV